jgi:hypothetical protein
MEVPEEVRRVPAEETLEVPEESRRDLSEMLEGTGEGVIRWDLQSPAEAEEVEEGIPVECCTE